MHEKLFTWAYRVGAIRSNKMIKDHLLALICAIPMMRTWYVTTHSNVNIIRMLEFHVWNSADSSNHSTLHAWVSSISFGERNCVNSSSGSHFGWWFIRQTASFHSFNNFKAHSIVSNVKIDSVLCAGKMCFFPGKWDFWRTDVKHHNIFSFFNFDTRRPPNQEKKVTLESMQKVVLHTRWRMLTIFFFLLNLWIYWKSKSSKDASFDTVQSNGNEHAKNLSAQKNF